MPRGNGTGPMPGAGRGQGMGQGRGGGFGAGGECICPSCGKKAPHQRGTPCNEIKCPDCGTLMTRAQ